MKMTLRTLLGCASDKARSDAAFDACFLRNDLPETLEHLIQATSARFMVDLVQKTPELSESIQERICLAYCNAYLDWLPLAIDQIRLRISLQIQVERDKHAPSTTRSDLNSDI